MRTAYVSKVYPYDYVARVELNLNESGTLCNLLMSTFAQSGGLVAQPQWAIDLYEKLAAANDRVKEKWK